METQDHTTSPEPAQEQKGKKEHHTGSRIALAAAFAWVGWHLAPIGLAIDGASILKGEKNKLRAIHGLRGKLKEKIQSQLGPNPTTSEKLKARAGIFKYTLIFTAIGVAAGAIIGWVRGDRAGSLREIIHHPIKAMKAVFGPKAKEQENPVPTPAKARKDTMPSVPSNTQTNWRQRASEQQEQAVAAAVSRLI